MTCEARRLLFDYYREKPRKPCPIRLPRFFSKMAEICAIPTKPFRRSGFRFDGLITPTYAARRVSEIRKRLKAMAQSAAKTKKRYAFDYCLTTKKQKSRPTPTGAGRTYVPVAQWIARRTPTPKVAGSNPVGHTTPSRLRRAVRVPLYLQRVMQLIAGGFFVFIECVSVDVQRCRDLRVAEEA